MPSGKNYHRKQATDPVAARRRLRGKGDVDARALTRISIVCDDGDVAIDDVMERESWFATTANGVVYSLPKALDRPAVGMRTRVGAVLCGMAAILAACGGKSSSSSTPMTTSSAALAAPADQMVDVGGHELHLVCQGSATPTVLIELGAGQSVAQWNATQPQLAAKHRTGVYERAGSGSSEPGAQPRRAKQVTDDLLALLGAAQIPTPLIIVSHSLGGMYTQLFAAEHEDLVAGLVFIEPRTAEYQLGYQANLTPAELAEDAAADAQAIANEPFGGEIARSDESARQVTSAGALPHVPTIVLTAGVPFEGQSTADREFWMVSHQHLAAQAGGEAHVVDGAEHEIWLTHSDAVLQAVDEVAAKI